MGSGREGENGLRGRDIESKLGCRGRWAMSDGRCGWGRDVDGLPRLGHGERSTNDGQGVSKELRLASSARP
jgi:hypothetical protein